MAKFLDDELNGKNKKEESPTKESPSVKEKKEDSSAKESPSAKEKKTNATKE